MTLDLLTSLYIVTALGVIVLFLLLPRYGPHYVSRLTCPSCKKVFNFHWIPGVTITSIIYRNKRNLKCPYCHVKSTYDVASTRVRKTKNARKTKPKP
jgi:primosomal protein N'